MRRLLSLALPAMLLLCAPAAVSPKKVSAAKVCGADGCRAIQDADESIAGGQAARGPAAAEPFVRLRFTIGDGAGYSERISNIFLPQSGLLLADDGSWMRPGALAELRAAARHVELFAASRLPESVPLFAIEEAPAKATPAAPAAETSDGLGAWWLALPAAAVAVGVLLVARRRHRAEGRPRAAGATG